MARNALKGVRGSKQNERADSVTSSGARKRDRYGSGARYDPTRSCDPTWMMRKVHRVLFQHFLAADMRRSCSLGATGAELECFLDVALGRCQPLSIDYAL